MILIWGITFLFGLCIGSFLNVIVYRLPRKLNFIKGRSFCPQCKKKICWFDNIPLISFIILKGRCRHCHSPIPWQYPAIELITGLLTLLITNYQFPISNQYQIFNFQNICQWGLILLLFWGLIVIFFIDLEHQIIPDEVIAPLIILFFVWSLVFGHWSFLLTAVAAFFFFFIIYFFTKGRGLGFGDVKFAFLMGIFLGYPKIIIAFYLAFLTGALIGSILILFKKAKFGQKIAFGPFLVLATIITYLWGEKILFLVNQFLF